MKETEMKTQTTCCVCGRWRIGDEWVAQGGLTLSEGVYLSHGYCPTCATEAMTDFRAEMAKAKK